MHLRHESYFCMYQSNQIVQRYVLPKHLQNTKSIQILGSGILWGAVHDTLTSCLFVLHSAFLDDAHNVLVTDLHMLLMVQKSQTTTWDL